MADRRRSASYVRFKLREAHDQRRDDAKAFAIALAIGDKELSPMEIVERAFNLALCLDAKAESLKPEGYDAD